jgi:hypothetical protein
LSSASLAGQSADSLIAAGLDKNCAKFAEKVSASEGNFKSRNPYGCLGAFQFCPGTFELYYKGTPESFLNSPAAQVKAWTAYEKTQWAMVKKYNLDISGQVITYNNVKFTVDQSAILMACQFGCGKNGKLAKFVALKDCNNRKVKDGNLVSVCEYLKRGAGYRVDCFTGEPQKAISPDDNKKDQVSPAVHSCRTTEASDVVELTYNAISICFKASISFEDLKRIISAIKQS